MKDAAKLSQIALFSRIFLLILQYIANQIIPDHDAKVFMYPAPKNKTEYDKIINHLFGGFLRWDAQYFMHIAKFGYTYENTLAFFPLYPLSVGYLGQLMSNFFGMQYLDSILLVTFIMVNIFVFKCAALSLYRLTIKLFDKSVAYGSAVLFCLNPASIFFIAPYTECIFSYLSFQSMLNCLVIYEKYSKPASSFSFKDLTYLIPIALSTVTRSNGVLNIGFLIYTVICLYLKHVKSKKSFLENLFFTLKYVILLLVFTLLCMLPFIIYQLYCFESFCTTFESNLPLIITDHAKKNKFILPGMFKKYHQKWCTGFMPLAYSYVQDHYWDVGFLRYYEFKQLPNFLLALPILTIVIFHCLKHLYVNFFKRSGWDSLFTLETPKNCKVLIELRPKLTVFVVHALFLSIFCLFFIHIQVSTRLLCSASPLFYWICSKQVNLLKVPGNSDSLVELFLRTYFVSFFIAGTLLFCNFLPWT